MTDITQEQLTELLKVLNGPEGIVERMTSAQAMLRKMIDAGTRTGCPDGGTCHHGCIGSTTKPCFRVLTCAPLSGTFAGDEWPIEIFARERALDAAQDPEPWPIKNAIGCLKEAHDRALEETEHGRTVRGAMNYAIEIVKGINSKREPQPPSPEEQARRAIRGFCKEIGTAFENMGLAIQDIASGDMPDGWNPWTQTWERQ